MVRIGGTGNPSPTECEQRGVEDAAPYGYGWKRESACRRAVDNRPYDGV